MIESSQPARWRFWVAIAAVFLLALWLLNDILLPFVVGMVVAYVLDPLVARLQRLGMSRTWATTAVTIFAVLLAVGGAMAILPPLFAQLQSLILNLPDYTVKLAARITPLIDPIRERLDLPPLSLQELQAEVAQRAGQVLTVSIDTDRASLRLLEDAQVTEGLNNFLARLPRNGDYTIEIQNSLETDAVINVNIKIR